MADLTDKQKRFCDEYLKDYNGTRAAIVAGYSENSARSIASDLLTNPNIVSYLDKKKDKLSNKLNISQERVLKELAAIAFSDTKSMYDESGEIKPIHEWPEDLSAAVSMVNKGKGIVSKWDKLKALEMISKILGYNAPDKVEQTVNQRTVIIDTTGTDGNSVHEEASGS